MQGCYLEFLWSIFIEQLIEVTLCMYYLVYSVFLSIVYYVYVYRIVSFYVFLMVSGATLCFLFLFYHLCICAAIWHNKR